MHIEFTYSRSVSIDSAHILLPWKLRNEIRIYCIPLEVKEDENSVLTNKVVGVCPQIEE